MRLALLIPCVGGMSSAKTQTDSDLSSEDFPGKLESYFADQRVEWRLQRGDAVLRAAEEFRNLIPIMHNYKVKFRALETSTSSDTSTFTIQTNSFLLLDTGSSSVWISSDLLPSEAFCDPTSTHEPFEQSYADGKCYHGFTKLPFTTTLLLQADLDDPSSFWRLPVPDLAIVTSQSSGRKASFDGVIGLSPDSEVFRSIHELGLVYTSALFGAIDVGKAKFEQRCTSPILRFPVDRSGFSALSIDKQQHWYTRASVVVSRKYGNEEIREVLIDGGILLWDTGYEQTSGSRFLRERIEESIFPGGAKPIDFCPPEDAELHIRSPLGGEVVVNMKKLVYGEVLEKGGEGEPFPMKLRHKYTGKCMRNIYENEGVIFDLSVGANIMRQLYVVFRENPMEVALCSTIHTKFLKVEKRADLGEEVQEQVLIEAGEHLREFPLLVNGERRLFKISYTSAEIEMAEANLKEAVSVSVNSRTWKQKISSNLSNKIGFNLKSTFLFNSGSKAVKFDTEHGRFKVTLNPDEHQLASCSLRDLPVDMHWDTEALLAAKSEDSRGLTKTWNVAEIWTTRLHVSLIQRKWSWCGLITQMQCWKQTKQTLNEHALVEWAPTDFPFLDKTFFNEHLANRFPGETCPQDSDFLELQANNMTLKIPLKIFLMTRGVTCKWALMETSEVNGVTIGIGGQQILESFSIVLKPGHMTVDEKPSVSVCNK